MRFEELLALVACGTLIGLFVYMNEAVKGRGKK